MDDARITNVYVWSNGMAMVFDQDGQQMPAFQGLYAEVKQKIAQAGGMVPIQHKVWPTDAVEAAHGTVIDQGG